MALEKEMGGTGLPASIKFLCILLSTELKYEQNMRLQS